MVGERWNAQTLVNLPVTDVPRCTSSNAKTLGLKHLQLPYMAASNGPPDGAHILHHGIDELPVQHETVPDVEATPSVQERTQHIQLAQPEKSAVAEHRLDDEHLINLQDTKILFTKSGYMDPLIAEDMESFSEPYLSYLPPISSGFLLPCLFPPEHLQPAVPPPFSSSMFARLCTFSGAPSYKRTCYVRHALL